MTWNFPKKIGKPRWNRIWTVRIIICPVRPGTRTGRRICLRKSSQLFSFASFRFRFFLKIHQWCFVNIRISFWFSCLDCWETQSFLSFHGAETTPNNNPGDDVPIDWEGFSQLFMWKCKQVKKQVQGYSSLLESFVSLWAGITLCCCL